MKTVEQLQEEERALNLKRIDAYTAYMAPGSTYMDRHCFVQAVRRWQIANQLLGLALYRRGMEELKVHENGGDRVDA